MGVTEEANKADRDHPGLYFIHCNGPSRPSKKGRPASVRRHVMLASLAQQHNRMPAAQHPFTTIVQDNQAQQPIVTRPRVSTSCQKKPGLHACRTSTLVDGNVVISPSEPGDGYLKEICRRVEDNHASSTVMSLSTQMDPESLNRGQQVLLSGMNALQHKIMRLKRSTALPSSGPSFLCGSMDTAEIARWHFCSHLRDSATQMFGAATYHWVEKVWDSAKHCEIILQCVAISALFKKAALTGVMDLELFHIQKGRLIRDLQFELTHQPPSQDVESPLSLVVAMMAEFEGRDLREQSTTEVHLRGLSKLMPTNELSDVSWSYAVRADLRQALISSQSPVLPYYIPPAYRNPLTNNIKICTKASVLASWNCQTSPGSSAFTDARSFEFFRNLHQMCLAWDELHLNPVPPLGHVYNFSHRLRVIGAEIKSVDRDNVAACAVALVLIAIQLHIWIVSRFWSTIARNIQACVMQRAFDLLRLDMVETWTHSGATLHSLLWSLATLAAARFDICTTNDPLLMSLLGCTCERLDIYSLSVFESELKRWPWLENWHTLRMELVWVEVSKTIVGAEPVGQISIEAAKLLTGSQDANESRKRWFLGGLEFYSSL